MAGVAVGAPATPACAPGDVDVWAALGYVVFLIAYGNAKTRAVGASPAGSLGGVGAGLALVGAVGLWSRALRLALADLGVTEGRAAVGRSLHAGMLWGLALGAIPVAAAALRLLPADRPEGQLSRPALRRRLLAYLPLDTVLPEELAFRGLLLAWLLRAWGLHPRRPLAKPPAPPLARSQRPTHPDSPPPVLPWLRHPATRAVLLAALPFTLWHLEIARREMPTFRARELAGKLAAYYAGGVVFGYLRVTTGHLAGSLAAHWLFNALAMLAARAAAR